MPSKTILVLPFLLPLIGAICPGYNYAFFAGNSQLDGWIYTADDSCKIVASGYCDNPCECRYWGCGPDHSVDNVLVNGLWYYCRGDSNAGTCGSDANQIANLSPQSCCRNDGKRNFEEGLISKRHADAIGQTNALLERHEQQYQDAEKNGFDTVKLRRRQASEVEESMKREEEAAVLGH